VPGTVLQYVSTFREWIRCPMDVVICYLCQFFRDDKIISSHTKKYTVQTRSSVCRIKFAFKEITELMD
jgi:hypothetical protein